MAATVTERAQELMRKHSHNELQNLARAAGAGRISRKTKFALATDVILAEDRKAKPDPKRILEENPPPDKRTKDAWEKALEEAMKEAFDGAKDELPKGGRRDYDAYGRPIPQPKPRPEPRFSGSIKGFEWNGRYYRQGLGTKQFITPDGYQFHRNPKTNEWEQGTPPDEWDKAIQDKQRQMREEMERKLWRKEFPPDPGARQRERALENEIQKLRARVKQLEEENKALQGDIDFLLGDPDETESGSPSPAPPGEELFEAGTRTLWCRFCNKREAVRRYINKDAWKCITCGMATSGSEAMRAGKLEKGD